MTPAHLGTTAALLAACTLLTPAPARADLASLVADLNRTGPAASSAPRFFAAAGERALFSAVEPGQGQRLWVTDGSAAGTRRLAEGVSFERENGELDGDVLFLGADTFGRGLFRTDGTPEGTRRALPRRLVWSPTDLLRLPGGLYFFAPQPSGPTAGLPSLWRTDGTVAGTTPVVSLGDRLISSPAVAGGRVFFFASEGRPQEGFYEPLVWKLWQSDGTAAGTRAVKTLGAFPPPHSPVAYAAGAGGRLFFRFYDQREEEIWASDGTAGGTLRLTSLANPFPFGSSASFTAHDGGIDFVADDGEHGYELWTSDGTRAGTRRMTDLASPAPFGDSLGAPPFVRLGARVLFAAADAELGRELWATDGEPASTALLADACPGECSGVDEGVSLAVLGDRVAFAVRGPRFPARSGALWASDGTRPGTGPLLESCPDPCPLVFDVGYAADGEAYFLAGGEGASLDLWKSDGTVAGTLRLTDLAAQDASAASPVGLLKVGRRLFFSGFDAGHGSEPWTVSTEGRPATARRVTDVATGRGPASNPLRLADLGGRVVFFACDGTSERLWASGGTAAATVELHDLETPCLDFETFEAPFLAAVGGVAYFQHGGLWRTDGTPEGTFPLTGFDPFDYTGFLTAPQPYQGGAVFAAQRWTETHQGAFHELWRTDGTPEGTEMLLPLPYFPILLGFRAVGDRLFFFAQGEGWELWTNDGTFGSSRKLTELHLQVPFGAELVEIAQLGDTFFFTLDGSLWATDGTPEGTRRRSDLVPGSIVGFPHGLLAAQGSLFLLAPAPGGSGLGLWKTDGTGPGTAHLATVGPFASGVDGKLVEVGSGVYFIAIDAEYRRRLWRSDGTPEGTSAVSEDLGEPGEVPGELVAAGDRLFFLAQDAAHGIEPWTSDGTPAGTRLLQDVAPGASAYPWPTGLTVSGDRLFFAADDLLHGQELWSLPLSGPAGCVPSATVLCLGEGRFAVQALFRPPDGGEGEGRAAPLAGDSGAFWFFRQENLDLFVKLLDGSAANGRQWLFVGSLSNVAFTLTITDLETGAARRYENLLGQLASFADTAAFPRSKTGSCAPASDRLCLAGGRFAVEVAWQAPSGAGGAGAAVPWSDASGLFWFFRDGNLEAAAKLVDGTAVNGHHWFFWASLSNLEQTITVTDTATGTVKTYFNPQGTMASFVDLESF